VTALGVGDGNGPTVPLAATTGLRRRSRPGSVGATLKTMTTGGAVPANRKRLFVSSFLGAAGKAVLSERDDVETISFPGASTSDELDKLLVSSRDVHGIIVGLTRIGENEITAAGALEVVARIGVGFDTIDVPALTAHGIPLLTVGMANSVSVAEQAMFFMLTLAKRGAHFHSMVSEGRWTERLTMLPADLAEKTVLIVGFGRIGTRIARRCLAMDMTVLVYDPYVAADAIRSAGCAPVADLDAALPRADFVTLHCPKGPETIGLINAARLKQMKPTAYLINTARGGIADEAALHAALTGGVIAGAGIEVFDKEPPDAAHPLLKLTNVVTAPHMAGVTQQSIERMAVQAARNVLSVFDGRPLRENAVNPEVFA
jgi:D-3-phosphoglycerate dehydrogenase